MGPQVVESAITEVTFECRDTLEDHISDDEEDELALVVVDGVPMEKKSLHLLGTPSLTEAEEATGANAVPFSNQDSQENFDSSELSSGHEPEQDSVPLDIQESEPDSSSNYVPSSQRTYQVAEDEDSERGEDDMGLFSDEMSALIEEGDMRLPISYGTSTNFSVLEWVKEHQVWVELFNKHGKKISVMDEILKNLKAPVKSWKTIIANICKEASLNSKLQSFVVCPGHVCYANLFNSPENNFCSDCGSPKPQATAATSVQYIPILPRIQSILLEEQSCKSLFQYHQTFQSVPGTHTDYFDSASYHRLCGVYESKAAVSWDIFISASTDGFQAYKNRTLDVWPVVAILLNLSPEQRYSVKNVLPLMFIPHGRQPSNLQSFLIPLINEVTSTFPDGVKMKFYDASERRVRLHLVWFSADLDALKKVAALTGHNGKTPCRFCDIQGVYCPASRHYYFPCIVHLTNVARRSRRYNPGSLPLRTPESINSAIMRLLSAATASKRTEESKETGIKGESILFQVPNFVPYHSFPVDIMHLFYNVQKHLISIHTSNIDDAFCLSCRELEVLDSELLAFGDGISGQLAPAPRTLSTFQTWKAAEHKNFTLYYYMVLFDGYIPGIFMDGLEMYVKIVDLSFRPILSAGFIRHFEKHFMRHDAERLKLSTYVMHLLLHLAECVRENGSLVNTSQYWVERYIGWIVDRLNAKRLPAASLRNSALFTESYKMMFSLPFTGDDTEEIISTGDGFKLLKLIRTGDIESTVDPGLDLKRLMTQYLIRNYDGMTVRDARVISNDTNVFRFWGKLRFRRNRSNESQTASVSSNSVRGRPSHYVAAEMDESESKADVYYGKMLHLLEVDLSIPDLYRATRLPDNKVRHSLAVVKWAIPLSKGRQLQVFVKGRRHEAFSSETLEDVSIVKRLISVVEHAVSSVGKERRGMNQRAQRKTYFLDSDLRKDSLLNSQRGSDDGVNRVLKGLTNRK